jgi:hypothetical protein
MTITYDEWTRDPDASSHRASVWARLFRTHYLAPDARQRPGEMPVRTALSPRLLIRMRSQVQVLAGPPPIVAGHSGPSTEPGALAAGLGRAGAAPPSPLAPPVAPPGPPTRPSGSATTTHRGRVPSRGRPPRGGCRHLALQPAPCPRRYLQPQAAPRAGLACLVAQGQARPPRPAPTGGPGPPPTSP